MRAPMALQKAADLAAVYAFCREDHTDNSAAHNGLTACCTCRAVCAGKAQQSKHQRLRLNIATNEAPEFASGYA